jgi:hypothetical protein
MMFELCLRRVTSFLALRERGEKGQTSYSVYLGALMKETKPIA